MLFLFLCRFAISAMLSACSPLEPLRCLHSAWKSRYRHQSNQENIKRHSKSSLPSVFLLNCFEAFSPQVKPESTQPTIIIDHCYSIWEKTLADCFLSIFPLGKNLRTSGLFLCCHRLMWQVVEAVCCKYFPITITAKLADGSQCMFLEGGVKICVMLRILFFYDTLALRSLRWLLQTFGAPEEIAIASIQANWFCLASWMTALDALPHSHQSFCGLHFFPCFISAHHWCKFRQFRTTLAFLPIALRTQPCSISSPSKAHFQPILWHYNQLSKPFSSLKLNFASCELSVSSLNHNPLDGAHHFRMVGHGCHSSSIKRTGL